MQPTTQNLQHINDALFYYTRSHELVQYRHGGHSDEQIGDYLTILNVLENSVGLRGRRVQILLTHGSILRHHCGQKQNISGKEFEVYMKEGLEYYDRAFSSAKALNFVTHILNAVSYSLDFCAKSLTRMSNCNIAEIANLYHQSLKKAESILTDEFTMTITAPGDKTILESIRLTYPGIKYLALVLDQENPIDKAIEILIRIFKSFENELQRLVDEKTPSYKRFQHLQLIDRVFIVSQQYNSQRHRGFIGVIKPYVHNILKKNKEMETSQNNRIRKTWLNLSGVIR